MRIRSLLAAAPLAVLMAGAASAQSTAPGSTGVTAPQSGSTGSPNAVSGTPTGQPADTRSNSSSSSSNAGQPERAAPQGGGGK